MVRDMMMMMMMISMMMMIAPDVGFKFPAELRATVED